MIKEIMKDDLFLSQKSVDATKADLPIAQDLLDTLAYHHEKCVGMAANMIGIHKNIIVIKSDDKDFVLFNPKIIKMIGKTYEADEGCLSHQGTKKVTRYESIKVEYLDEQFKKRIKTFSAYTAQIIQHQIDHCLGILI